jgi:hypothetical protein
MEWAAECSAFLVRAELCPARPVPRWRHGIPWFFGRLWDRDPEAWNAGAARRRGKPCIERCKRCEAVPGVVRIRADIPLRVVEGDGARDEGAVNCCSTVSKPRKCVLSRMVCVFVYVRVFFFLIRTASLGGFRDCCNLLFVFFFSFFFLIFCVGMRSVLEKNVIGDSSRIL